MKAIEISPLRGARRAPKRRCPTPSRAEARRSSAWVRWRQLFRGSDAADRYAVTPELPMIPGVEVAGASSQRSERIFLKISSAVVSRPMFAHGAGTADMPKCRGRGPRCLVPDPDDLSFEAGCSMMVQGLTASLSRPAKRAAEQNAADQRCGSGVGSLLRAIGKEGGARTIVAVASSEEKPRLRPFDGCSLGINYAVPDWTATLRRV